MEVGKTTQSKQETAVDTNTALLPREALLDLLVSVRGASIESEEKTRLRDLVLEYAKGADNATQQQIQEEILDILKTYPDQFSAVLARVASTQPVATAANTTAAAATPKAALRGARPKPQFGQPTVAPTQTAAQEAPAPSPAPAQPSSAADTAAVAEHTVHEPEATKVPVQQPAAPTPEAAPAPAPTYTTATNPTARIKEIKHHINEQVGNPVNLVDVDNEVGREYMNALLAAMKKTTSGTGGIDAAMERLEKAYAAAITKLAEHENEPETASSEEAKPEPTTPAEPEQTEQPAPAPVPEPEPAPEPAQQEPEPTPAPTEARSDRTPVQLRKEPEQPAPEPTPQQSEQSTPVTEPEPAPEPAQEPAAQQPAKHSLRALAESVKLSRNERTAARTTTTRQHENAFAETPAQNTEEAQPAATPAPPETPTPEEAPKEEAWSTTATETTTAQQPTKKQTDKASLSLESTEVTEGLSQLLSEWKLFKRSGFLGTGPKGIEHPLYKQLAHVPMASIISGRFEGATPEVKQTLTDYINGWRYEQNITPDMGETFEHYLRRVILHILNRKAAH